MNEQMSSYRTTIETTTTKNYKYAQNISLQDLYKYIQCGYNFKNANAVFLLVNSNTTNENNNNKNKSSHLQHFRLYNK